MTRQKVSLGYIADAGLKLDTAHDALLAGAPLSPEAVVEILEAQQLAIENVVTWARQVNRALSSMPEVDVDDHPID